MKKYIFILFALFGLSTIIASCNDLPMSQDGNTSALTEQKHTEKNQRNLMKVQPPPTITWSLERDNIIKRELLQNDRSVMFYMYVFVEGVGQPIGYYLVNKVSSVNSQLTNTMQIINGRDASNNLSSEQIAILPSPAEDGSYGTNGDGVFGFTPDDVYIETDMHYIVSTVPLTFEKPVTRLATINNDEMKKILDISKQAMSKR